MLALWAINHFLLINNQGAALRKHVKNPFDLKLIGDLLFFKDRSHMKRRAFITKTAAAGMLASAFPARLLKGCQGMAGKSEPNICIFSKHLHWLDYREMARMAAEIGFSGIDLTVRKNGHVLPENVRRDLPLAVAEVRAAGLEVPMITTGITDPSDPFTRDILETAGKLGIGLYRSGWFKYMKGVPAIETVKQARKQLTQLQNINKANNIAASYQNHSGLYVGSSGWDLLKMIDGLDPKWTGVQFDIRHAMVEGPNTWPIFLEILAPYINSLDIKDFTWTDTTDPKLLNVPLGEGMVPFRDYLDELKRYEISAPFSIHYEYPLGGAEHGTKELGIPKEKFIELVGSDLQYFKSRLTS